MRPPEDEVLLRDMLDYARRAVEAVAERDRSDLDSDLILAPALERFIEAPGRWRAFPEHDHDGFTVHILRCRGQFMC